MTFTFTQAQIDDIQDRLSLAEQIGDYSIVYDYIFSIITDDENEPDEVSHPL